MITIAIAIKIFLGRFFLLQICLPPFFRRRLIMDIKTPQYEKIQVGFPRPSFYNNKGEFFLSKKSVKASLFSTHYVSIYHNLPRCRQGWSCFCGHDGFANPKCLHLSFHRPMNQNYKQRYFDFIMCFWLFQFLLAGQIKLQVINALRFRTFLVR